MKPGSSNLDHLSNEDRTVKMQDICAAMLPALVVGFATLPVQSQNLAKGAADDPTLALNLDDLGGPAGGLPPPPGRGRPMGSMGGPMGAMGSMHAMGGGPVTMGFGMGMPPMGPPGGPGGMLPLGALDLTDDQMEKIGELRADIQDKSGPIMLKLQSLQREFRSGLAQANINTAELKRINGEISAQKQALDTLRSQEMISTAELLTKEQRQEMKQTMNRAEFGAGFGKRFTAKSPAK